MPSEKAKIVVEAKDKATKEMRGIRKEFGKMVGAIAAGNIAANLADKALGSLTAGLGQLVTATKVAARIEVLNRVVTLTGKAAGISALELEDNKQAIINLGIAEQEALSIQQRFIQVQLDIADAVKIARVAQDLAVIAGTNSSDTALQLTDALVKQRPILLKQFGIIADLNDIYGQQADALGKTVEQLNQTEKRQAFLNEILRQSKTVAGAYESAMKDVGKRLTSLPRHVQNAQNAIGQLFLPMMGAAVDGTTDMLKMVKLLGDSLSNTLPKAVKASASALRQFKGTEKVITDLLAEYTDLVEKTKLSEKEHKKLDGTIRQLANLLPNAVTKWNEYGEAIEISSEAVERLIRAQEGALRAEFIHNVGRLRTEFQELGEVDLAAVTDKMAELATERDRLSKIDKGSRIIELSPQKWIDPLRDVNNELKRLNELLTGTTDRKTEIIALSSTMYPALKKGTEDYRNALIFLQAELFNAVLAHQSLDAAAQVSAANTSRLQLFMSEETRRRFQKSLDSETDIHEIRMNNDREERLEAELNAQSELDASELVVADMDKFLDNYKKHYDSRKKLFKSYVKEVLGGEEEINEKRERLMSAIGAITMRGVNRMTDSLMQGKFEAKAIFASMAEDFARFFIQQAIIKLITIFIPGLTEVLGGVFDTPSNDRMAMEQGRHYAQFFTQGAMAEMSQFPMAFAGAVAGPVRGGGIPALFPEAANASGGGGGNVTLQFHNPIMTRNFVEHDVVDIIEQAARDGANNVVIDDSNMTGQDDGAII